MHTDDMIDCHVLVVGSGGAGARAALEASTHGDTILLSKTFTGKGGCTIMAEGGYNAVLDTADSIENHREDTLTGGAYLNDPELVEILVRESPQRFLDLIRWGAIFDITPEHTVAQRAFGGQRFDRTCYAGDRSGHEMMMTLVEQIRSSNIEQMQEATVIELLTSGDRVCGALALDRNNELVVIQADSTILATGGGTQVYDVSTNSASGTGSGYVLGYRAGATLIDMEMVQFHPTGAVYPHDVRGRLITEAVRGEGGLLLNTKGERFMERYDPERMELSTRDVVSRSIGTEILEGRGTEHGGVYLDVSHLPPVVIEEHLPIMLEQFLQFGVDIRKEPMEVAPTAHHIMGGLRITPDCQTTIPGLYACGEVTGGVHGANRLGGNALSDTQVFGKRAGKAAGTAPSQTRGLNRSQIEAQEQRLSSFYEGEVQPATVVKEIKKTMWDYTGIFRTEDGLLKARSIINRLAENVPYAASRQNLTECCMVQDMISVASMIIEGALLRRESRGAHVRTDITQSWTPQTSPFGHIWQSIHGNGVERREDNV